MADASSAISYGHQPSKSPDDPADKLERGWRTPTLWGLAASAPFMHDGRAPTIEQAIAQHGGQGEFSARAYSRQPVSKCWPSWIP